VAVVLFTFVRLLAKPEMTVLYSNMEQADAQCSASTHLKTIPVISFEPTVNPYSSRRQLDSARLELLRNHAPQRTPGL